MKSAPQTAATWFKGWLETALGFFYGEICQSCEKERASRENGYICSECREQVKFIKPPFCQRCGTTFQGEITTLFVCGNCRNLDLYFSHARAAVRADEVVRQVLHEYKYHKALWVEPFLASLLNHAAVPELRHGAWDMIVPVPLHPRRRAEREFNQAERLGRLLSRATGIPLETRVLRRVIDTPTQTRLSRKERSENMRNAFAFRGSRTRIEGRRIVLCDDVLTTGATASACARVLRNHGASEVCAWTLARGLLH